MLGIKGFSNFTIFWMVNKMKSNMCSVAKEAPADELGSVAKFPTDYIGRRVEVCPRTHKRVFNCEDCRNCEDYDKKGECLAAPVSMYDLSVYFSPPYGE